MSNNSKTYGTYPRDNQGKGSESMDANNSHNTRGSESRRNDNSSSSSSSNVEKTKSETKKSIFNLFS